MWESEFQMKIHDEQFRYRENSDAKRTVDQPQPGKSAENDTQSGGYGPTRLHHSTRWTQNYHFFWWTGGTGGTPFDLIFLFLLRPYKVWTSVTGHLANFTISGGRIVVMGLLFVILSLFPVTEFFLLKNNTRQEGVIY
jgi:hypothetical protein